ncbi:MAG: 1-deoxy-D-xylulose-5-phosphate synthase, partial [Candidatus Aureabacteria bacterium]|nr:1-deoxy-D-xylulose-5-phosphate synthase [Candidatus Auribacterota bacterium]
NAVGVATGLASCGFIPGVYSIATFASLRPYEQIRNGPALHRLPVRIVGIGGGFEYGHAGLTHAALEDIGIMRGQPRITVIAPADRAQTAAAIRATYDLPGPIYYRLGKSGAYHVPHLDGRFTLGRCEVVREGTDILLIAMGGISIEACIAAEQLALSGIAATVAIVSSFNPAPEDDLAALLIRFPLALTVEAHYVVGALGSFVAELVAERAIRCRVVRCGVQAMPDGVGGGAQYLYRMHGLSGEQIAATAQRALDELRATSPGRG